MEMSEILWKKVKYLNFWGASLESGDLQLQYPRNNSSISASHLQEDIHTKTKIRSSNVLIKVHVTVISIIFFR